jgi:hypothetical protein
MPPWTRRSRACLNVESLMRDLWHLFRGSLPRLEGMTHAFEKGGMTLDNQAVPWGAESVLVSAVVEMPQQAPRAKGDFELHVDHETVLPESQRLDDLRETVRLQFRVPVPARPTSAELVWRGRSIGQIALPLLSAEDFTKKFCVQMPTVSVRLGKQPVACQTYVTKQCQGLIVSAVVQSPTSLVPILDLGMRVEIRRQEGGPADSVVVKLSNTQLRARQALVSVVPPKPKRMGTWHITWFLGERPLATQIVNAISQKRFLRSLRVSSTRFVLQHKNGNLRVERFLPDFKGVARVGPCFLVSSSETGMAGWCTLQVRAHVKGSVEPPLLQEQEVLITDGPQPFVPGTLDVGELEQVKHFELRSGRDVLGTLPLSPVPTAAFTQEGGFIAPDNFEWSPTAEEQLKDRLGKLLGS